MKVGFIGLGNVGAKLAGTLVRNGFELVVRDPDPAATARLVAAGAEAAPDPATLTRAVDVVITCLPSPAICAEVMTAPDGVIAGLADVQAKEDEMGRKIADGMTAPEWVSELLASDQTLRLD